MKNEYKHTKTTVSMINYHFVFCPRYRRKIFNIPGVEQRFKELTIAECDKCGIAILALGVSIALWIYGKMGTCQAPHCLTERFEVGTCKSLIFLERRMAGEV